MIRIFRKIRQGLLRDSLTTSPLGKYILYALGEIALVVVGILIALQINNWNVASVNRKQETKLLIQLKSDLSKNQEEIVDLRNRLTINKTGIDSLLANLEIGKNSVMFPLYVSFLQRKSFFNNASSGYKMIQNGMATYISNQKVLGEVLELYESDFVGISQRQQLMHSEIESLRKNFIFKLFRPAPNRFSFQFSGLDEVPNDLFVPLNFETLSDNVEFLNNLLQLKKSLEIRLVFIDKTTKKIEEALILLDSEM